MTGPARRVAITGMGVVCSIAADINEFRSAIREGRCGIRRLQPENTSIQFEGTLGNFDFDAWLDQLSSTAAPFF